MQTFEIRDEFIKLGQALKAAGFVESGVDAKFGSGRACKSKRKNGNRARQEACGRRRGGIRRAEAHD